MLAVIQAYSLAISVLILVMTIELSIDLNILRVAGLTDLRSLV